MVATRLCRVLCVDDDPDLRNIITMCLQDVGGYAVEACESGEEAIRKAPVFNPQVILLDLMMPKTDGVETLITFRCDSRLDKAAIIFLTAKTSSVDRASLISLGAFDVIAKPFDPMQLHSQISDIWQRFCSSAGASVAVK